MDQDMGSGYAIASVNETSVSAVAAQAKATVEARYIMALQRPRDWDVVRQRIMKACNRSRFAEGARYAKPIGGKNVEGPSIRFAEEAVRAMGNIDVQTPTLYEDEQKRIVRVSVTDLESNSTYSSDITIAKTVERSKVREGQTVISKRVNSYGKQVFLVQASDDELQTKTLAQVSKALRTGAIRLLPSDLLEEAMEAVQSTLRAEEKRDPDAARKRLLDAFSGVGVGADAIKQYLGNNDLSSLSPRDMDDLRTVYQAIKDGDTSWREVIESRLKTRDGETGKAQTKETAKRGASALKEKLTDKDRGDVIDSETGEVLTTRDGGNS